MKPPAEVGLCARCVHARKSENKRGSAFWQCRRAETNAAFRRYPELPVRDCAGFEPSKSARPSSA